MRLAILFLVLIFLIDLVFGLGLKFYRLFYFDMSLHFLGGIFVAMFFTEYLKNYLKADWFKKTLILVSVVMAVGVLWELLEYLTTVIFGNYIYENYRLICCIGNLDDTISDLTMDAFGAITFVLVLLYPSKSRTRQG